MNGIITFLIALSLGLPLKWVSFGQAISHLNQFAVEKDESESPLHHDAHNSHHTHTHPHSHTHEHDESHQHAAEFATEEARSETEHNHGDGSPSHSHGHELFSSVVHASLSAIDLKFSHPKESIPISKIFSATGEYSFSTQIELFRPPISA